MAATVTIICDVCGADDGGDPDYNVGDHIGLPKDWAEGDDGISAVCPDCDAAADT